MVDFWGCREMQLKIYALFMLADGKCTKEEGDTLNQIVGAMKATHELSEEQQKSVFSYCVSLHASDGDNSSLVVREIEKVLENDMGLRGFTTNIKAETIWNIINLGYCDKEFSEPEKKVLWYLSTRWNISEAVMAEFLDTAETLNLLMEHQAYVGSAEISREEKIQKLKEIRARIQLMQENIRTTIEEADVV